MTLATHQAFLGPVCRQAVVPGAGGAQLRGAGATGAGVRLELLPGIVEAVPEEALVVRPEHEQGPGTLRTAAVPGSAVQPGRTGQNRARDLETGEATVLAHALGTRVAGVHDTLTLTGGPSSF